MPVIGRAALGDNMLLKEFFRPAINTENTNTQNDELFWYLLDHDKLHKDFVVPLAKKIKKTSNEGQFDKSKIVKQFMPMVKKGCLEYYKKKNLSGNLGELFPKKLREELCEKLFNHFYEDVLSDDCYKLGI